MDMVGMSAGYIAGLLIVLLLLVIFFIWDYMKDFNLRRLEKENEQLKKILKKDVDTK